MLHLHKHTCTDRQTDKPSCSVLAFSFRYLRHRTQVVIILICSSFYRKDMYIVCGVVCACVCVCVCVCIYGMQVTAYMCYMCTVSTLLTARIPVKSVECSNELVKTSVATVQPISASSECNSSQPLENYKPHQNAVYGLLVQRIM